MKRDLLKQPKIDFCSRDALRHQPFCELAAAGTVKKRCNLCSIRDLQALHTGEIGGGDDRQPIMVNSHMTRSPLWWVFTTSLSDFSSWAVMLLHIPVLNTVLYCCVLSNLKHTLTTCDIHHLLALLLTYLLNQPCGSYTRPSFLCMGIAIKAQHWKGYYWTSVQH